MAAIVELYRSLLCLRLVPLTFVVAMVCLTPGEPLAASVNGQNLDDRDPNGKSLEGIPGVSSNLLRRFDDGVAGRRARAAAKTPRKTSIRADVVIDPASGITRAGLEAVGVRVVAMAPRYGRATVMVPNRAVLARLAGVAGVQMVAPDYGYRTHAGNVSSRAVSALNVDAIRAGTSADLTGAGVTVAILSDSMSRTSDVVDDDTQFDGTDDGDSGPKSSPVIMTGSTPQDTGDLPLTVQILRDDAPSSETPSDEGAAMAELIHDIAPDADIVFHTAIAGGIAGFADAIDTVCAPGSDVDIVVDDIGFLAELMYQRDPVSSAVEHCVDRGVPFFSAAGNLGNRGFRARFDDLIPADDAGRTKLLPPAERDFHDWAGGNPYLRVNVPDGQRVTAVLQWNQPALSVPGNADNGPRIDLDLLAFSARSPYSVINGRSSLADQQADMAGAGQDPIEIVQLDGASGGRTYYLAVDHWAGEQETIPQDDGTRLEFRLVFYENGNDIKIQYLDSAGGPAAGPTMYGHTVADGVLSVGAVPWFDTPAFPGANDGPTRRIDPEPYSALGGALERHFAADGCFHRGTQPPQPVLAATDGHNTTFFGSQWSATSLELEDDEDDAFPNFFGTSAAAPNAAAVAALLLEDDPTRTPTGVAGQLQTSAIDVTGRNAASGCDALTGSGLINAGAALGSADAPPEADAGDNQSVDAGDRVTLDGSGSTDDRFVDRYRWRQVGGARVSLTHAGGARTELEAPDADTTLVFELRVTDAACLSDADRVEIRVRGNDSGGGGSIGLLPLLLMAWCSRHGIRRYRGLHQRDS